MKPSVMHFHLPCLAFQEITAYRKSENKRKPVNSQPKRPFRYSPENTHRSFLSPQEEEPPQSNFMEKASPEKENSTLQEPE